MSACRIVYRLPRGSYGEIRAMLGEYRGRQRADFRLWIPDDEGEGEGDDLRPTKKGISVHVDDLPKLLEAVQALIDAHGEAA